MAEYQKIEYCISRDGKIIETVLNASGTSCISTTASIEKALGEVECQTLLPEYDEGEENLTTDEVPFLKQH